jgi:hypothetical protein
MEFAMKFLLPILLLSTQAFAGMSGSSQCQDCLKADNGVEMLCTLETDHVRGPVDEEDKRRAEALRARHQSALTEGLNEVTDPSLNTRHGNMGVAAAGKAKASKDSASACREARQKAEKQCKNECRCRNCERAGGQADKWDAQAAEDAAFAERNFEIQDSSDQRRQDSAREYAERARLREINRTPSNIYYPQQR